MVLTASRGIRFVARFAVVSQGQFVFSQIMDHLPLTTFRRCVDRYDGERKIKSFLLPRSVSLLCVRTADLAGSLRDIEACLRTQSSKLYRLGFRCPRISRNTMANANTVRDWRIYADFAQHLIAMARELYIDAARVRSRRTGHGLRA
jgi:hypothetical protein